METVSFIIQSCLFISNQSCITKLVFIPVQTNINTLNNWSHTITYHQRFRFQLNRFQTYKFKWFSLLKVTSRFTMINFNNNGLHNNTNICFDHRFHLFLFEFDIQHIISYTLNCSKHFYLFCMTKICLKTNVCLIIFVSENFHYILIQHRMTKF